MPRPAPEDRLGPVGEQPSQVRVTVAKYPRGLTARSWLAAARWVARPRILVSLVTTLAAVAAGATGAARLIGRSGAPPGFPVRCVSLTIALHDPRFMRTDFDRALDCAHRGGVSNGGRRLRRSRNAPLAVAVEVPLKPLPVELEVAPLRGLGRLISAASWTSAAVVCV